MSPRKAKEILERLINNAAFLSGEQFGSAKRSEWTETARGVLERSFPPSSSILSSFETAQAFAFGADDTEQQLRDIANDALSSELAVLRSAVEQLNWEIEGEPTPVIANERAMTKSSLAIFVSHSSIDSDLAEAIVDLLRSALALNAREIRCSSVDGYKLPVGVNTESKLREEVNAASVVIGLITPNSLASSYVMFELGARWGSGLFLAPLLAGVRSHELTGPLSLLNALSSGNEPDLHHLLEGVGEKLHKPVQNIASYMKHVVTVTQLARRIPHAEDFKTATSQENVTLKAELASVKDQLEQKPKLKQYGDVHYHVVEGENIPYCPTCYGTRGHLIPLPAGESWSGGFRRHCPACHTFYYEKPMAKEQQGSGGRGGGSLSWMG